MNGNVLNTNFVVGMVLARELPRDRQVLVGLTTGQLPAASAVGVLGIKRLVDDRADFEARALRAEEELKKRPPGGDGAPGGNGGGMKPEERHDYGRAARWQKDNEERRKAYSGARNTPVLE